jgi:phosphopantetheinyl transferase
LSQLLGALPAELTIARGADGAPLVQGLTEPMRVSISHGRMAAVAVAGRVALLGVDLCDRADGPRIQRIARRFMSAEDCALAEGDVAWATLWALKEAAIKALGLALLEGGLRATTLSSIDPPVFERPHLQAAVEVGREDVVAVVWRE